MLLFDGDIITVISLVGYLGSGGGNLLDICMGTMGSQGNKYYIRCGQEESSYIYLVTVVGVSLANLLSWRGMELPAKKPSHHLET